MLRRVLPADVPRASAADPVDAVTRGQSAAIVAEVQEGGEAGLLRVAVRLGDIKEGESCIVTKAELKAAFDALPADQQALLLRTAARIRAFAEAQRSALREIEVPVPGGMAGHRVAPVETAGCYAPGGRYPLPSSVLMTAITARVAGVANVWVASPRPVPVTLAAAHVSGADGLLRVGGAQAIAALTFGVGGVPACDVIVGPGNRWVTAAKQIVSGRVGIDMLAGPSECLVLADASADPATIAADLLAQAEHDVDAVPILVTVAAPGLSEAVDAALTEQLKTLTTAPVAGVAVAKGGYCVVCDDLETAISVCDRIAPEHLEVMTINADAVGRRLGAYGGLFVGPCSAEVMGDYGAGPNHVLPTGATARYTGGLCVMTFCRLRTWLRLDDAQASQVLVADAAALARLEGLEGHARAAERRLL